MALLRTAEQRRSSARSVWQRHSLAEIVRRRQGMDRLCRGKAKRCVAKVQYCSVVFGKGVAQLSNES